jgi:hypothetical protein
VRYQKIIRRQCMKTMQTKMPLLPVSIPDIVHS